MSSADKDLTFGGGPCFGTIDVKDGRSNLVSLGAGESVSTTSWIGAREPSSSINTELLDVKLLVDGVEPVQAQRADRW
jgi:hypothetical protein